MTIYLIELNSQREASYGGYYWEANIDTDWGYFLTEEAAQAKANALNEQTNRGIYAMYTRRLEQAHRHAQEQAALLEKRNAALLAAGLDPIPGNTTAHLAPLTCMSFEEWLRSGSHNESYFEITSIEEAPSE